MELRDYQWEVILPALEGENIIIWLPTGSGKTRAAAYVCKRHLETRERAKVAVLVNRMHLVEQHYTQEFHALRDRFQVTPISSDSDRKFFFSQEVKLSDLVICTAKILQNALTSQDQDMHVELTDFSLLVIDECHHTHKDGVYNQIMEDYLERKMRGERKLPQILGLTASPGTGGATNFQGARQHILQICANLDTAKIMSSQKHRVHLEAQVPQPRKQYDVSHERPQDPLGRKLKETMAHIHQYLDVRGVPQDFGTQIYEQRIVELGTEENKTALLALASDPRSENPKLSKLEEILQEQFKTPDSSRGIIFTKTRQSAHALHKWIQENAKLARLGIKAAVLTGAGYSNQTKHMTQNEQQDVIKLFRKGNFNLLFSTSVAEEGLDIPECNIVVRYGLMTNEIAMVQARGRARAKNSLYSVLAKANSKEVSRERLNETLEELTQRVIEEVQAMPEKEYLDTITALQRSAIVRRKVKRAEGNQKRQLHEPDAVRLHCINCNVAVCHGSDLRTVEKMHHVNVNPDFKIYYNATSAKVEIPRNFKDWKPGGSISCANCGQAWGMEMIYRSVTLPILSIKNFVVATPDGNKQTKQWSRVTFAIEEFDYVEYCSSNLGM
ncbi:probable ATP-dependent RNA helicase DHX58 isoform X3 [Chelonia mydas]|uniref:probable ATP-dependent RNA helicase DHX58 isoform X3 n=1 Tax=Chelonia mydas TaxID=8469 RepID=UPI001CA8762C|nr:probable ATP-dependent RNA helicase DHX58 isoform X3 [Chelonia mydas]